MNKVTYFNTDYFLHSNFNITTLPIDIECKNDCLCLIDIHSLCKQFNSDLIVNIYFVSLFELKEICILDRHNKTIFMMNSKLNYILSTFHNKSYGTDKNVTLVPINFYLSSGTIKIKVNNDDINKKFKMIVSLVRCVSPDLDLPYRFEYLFWGKGYQTYNVRENDVINKTTHIIKLNSFEGKLVNFVVALEPFNKNSIVNLEAQFYECTENKYIGECIGENEDTNKSLITLTDPILNRIICIDKLNIKKYDPNIYIMPFTQYAYMSDYESTGYYQFNKQNNSYIECHFTLSNQNPESKSGSVFMHFWSPSYEIMDNSTE